MKRIMTFLCILTVVFSLISVPAQASAIGDTEDTNETYNPTTWPEGPEIETKAAIIIELSTGTILYEKNSKKTLFPASITKIMTAMLTLEHSSLNEIVSFEDSAIFGMDPQATRIGITPGEELNMLDCLYGLMLPSANEVANGMAEHVSGTQEAFVALMNQKAKELGCVNTNFSNPNGLHAEDHYTCAYDMALISMDAFKDSTFRKVSGTKTYVIPATNLMDEERPIANHHELLTGSLNAKWRYEGCLGGKTGFTTPAGYTMVTFAKRNGMEVVCVTMKSDTSALRYTENITLLDYVFNNFSLHNISQLGNAPAYDDFTLFTRFSPLFDINNSPLSIDMEANVVLPNGASVSNVGQTITYDTLDSLEEGENLIGDISYTYGDKTVGRTDILYHSKESLLLSPHAGEEDVLAPLPTQKSTESGKLDLKPFIIIGIVLILLLLCGLYYYFSVLPHKRKRRAYYERKRKRRENYKNNNDFLDL